MSNIPKQCTPSSAFAPMMTLEMDAPFWRMKTALSLPVSSSELQGRPRSNSLLPKLTLPVMVLGWGSDTMLPERVGMLRVCAAAMLATRERSAT